MSPKFSNNEWNSQDKVLLACLPSLNLLIQSHPIEIRELYVNFVQG